MRRRPTRAVALSVLLVVCSSGCGEDPVDDGASNTVDDGGGADLAGNIGGGDVDSEDVSGAGDSSADAANPDVASSKDAGRDGCTAHAHCPKPAAECKVGRCDPKTGCYVAIKPDGAVCDDGNACTTTDLCDQGDCNPGKLKLCTDGQACTADACDTASGTCTHKPRKDGTVCDDGNAATANDVCKLGQDGKVACVGETIGCTTSAACKDDGDLCNGVMYCDKTKQPAVCAVNPVTIVKCANGKDTACAKMTCNPATGACAMKPTADGIACDDGQKCTANDACKAGKCAPGIDICCKSHADCKDEEDGSLCNGTLYCDKQAGKCLVNPITIVKCSAVSDTLCSVNRCDKKTGLCDLQPVLDGKICNADGTPCTPNDRCKAGKCVADKANVCACKTNADCASKEDGNLCNGTLYCDLSSGAPKCRLNAATTIACKTVDDTLCAGNRCQPKTGQCAFVPLPNAATCDYDGNACTSQDRCEKGVCVGVNKVTCQCQVDADCGVYGNGNLCDGTLYCDAGSKTCRLNPATVIGCKTVDDGPCEATSCEPKSGKCSKAPLTDGTSCDADGNACTLNDTCKKGACQAGVNTCQCQVDADCKKLDDGSLCNGTLVCNPTTKRCVINPATVIKCSDWQDTDCHASRCDAKTGKCSLQPTNHLRPCNADDNPCTPYDTCDQGKCVAGTNICQCQLDKQCGAFDDNDACTAPLYCDKKGGKPPFLCEPTPGKKVSCKPGQCAVLVCDPIDGKCKASSKTNLKACDDGNACTADGCSKATGGCTNAPLKDGSVCDDGSICVTGELCAKGVCKGLVKDCDDGKACTADTCDAKKGCTSSPLKEGAACGDSKSCAGVGVCSKSICTGKKPRLWTRELGAGPSARLYSVAWLPIGRAMAVGDNGGLKHASPDHWIVVLDPFGKPLGEVKGTTKTHESERYYRVRASGSDAAVIIGGHFLGANQTGLLLRVDKDGKQLWRTKQTVGSVHNDLRLIGAETVVVGTEAVGKYPNSAIRRFDAKGKQLWQTVDTVAWTNATTVARHGPQDVVAVGTAPNFVMWLSRVDKAGKRVWTRKFRVSTSFAVNAALQRPNGGLYVAGRIRTPRGSALWRFDTHGSMLGRTTLQLEKNAEAYDVRADGADVAVSMLGLDPTGYGGSPGLARVDPDGNRRYVRGRKLTAARIARIAPAPGGGWIMVGYRSSYPSNQQSRAFVRRVDAWGHYGCGDTGKCDGLDHGDCGDGNMCLSFGCDPQKGCTKTNSKEACEDGKSCTFAGSCAFAKCGGTKPKLGAMKAAGSAGETVDGVVALGIGGVISASTARPAGGKRHAVLRRYDKGVVVHTGTHKSATDDIDVRGLAVGELQQFVALGAQGSKALMWIAHTNLATYVAYTWKSTTGTARLDDAAHVINSDYVAAGVELLNNGASKGLLLRNGQHKGIWWSKTLGDGKDKRAFEAIVRDGPTAIAVGHASAVGTGAKATLWLVRINPQSQAITFNGLIAKAAMIPRDAVLLADKTLIVAGGDNAGATAKAVLVRLDSNNNVLSTTAIMPKGAAGPATFNGLVMMPDGTLSAALEAGAPGPGTTLRTRWLTRHAAAGKLTQTFKLAGTKGADLTASTIATTYDGQLVIGGADIDPKSKAATPWLIRMDAGGQSMCPP